MTADLLRALGGVGLFLLGMTLMKEGLETLARGTMRRTLARFTTSPLSGVLTGAVMTVIVRSSSATTVTAVGFVGAGLLTFPQALGILFGANIGTTLTGWIVAVLGFKLELGTLAQPLLAVGALARLFGGPAVARAGMALAGFSLLFVAVDVLRDSLGGLAAVVTPTQFPDDTLLGRAQLVLAGVAMTLLTQSSSAGVAMALSALDAGAITLPQAAALVIGFDIGTTGTALLAALGGSVGMRRTGLAHVLYNVLTGVMAFALLGPFLRLAEGFAGGDAAVALVAFHSGFNVLGVVLVLPFTGAFARLIMALVPERGGADLPRLDPMLRDEPAAALDAAAAAAQGLTRRAMAEVAAMTRCAPTSAAPGIAAGVEALAAFLEPLRTGAAEDGLHRRHRAMIHVVDHLRRLARRLGQADAAAAVAEHPRLGRLARLMGRLVDGPALPSTTLLERLHAAIAPRRDLLRGAVIDTTAAGGALPDKALALLDGVRWTGRVSYHLWRIVHHLEAAQPVPALRDRGEDRS